MDWKLWGRDPILEKHGFTFDRTPAGEIRAPAGKIRVCAFHIDFDERPTCYVDLDASDLARARAVCEDLRRHCKGNVDYAIAYDERGAVVADGRPY